MFVKGAKGWAGRGWSGWERRGASWRAPKVPASFAFPDPASNSFSNLVTFFVGLGVFISKKMPNTKLEFSGHLVNHEHGSTQRDIKKREILASTRTTPTKTAQTPLTGTAMTGIALSGTAPTISKTTKNTNLGQNGLGHNRFGQNRSQPGM